MTSVVQDVYGANLATSGKLKLRARKLLALGSAEEVFDACVLLHEAARVERLAVQALPAAPASTLLSAAVEVCWCLVEGLDPPKAADAWADVLRARQGVDERQADAMTERLNHRYSALQQKFARDIKSSKTLVAIREATRPVGLAKEERRQARRELAELLKSFPGATSLHYMEFCLAEGDEDKPGAWRSLEKARQLEPGNPWFRAMSLLVAAWALPAAAAEKHLVGVRGTLDREDAEVCLMYAHAELTLARKASKGRQARWVRALEAANAGLSKAVTEGLRRNLKATQLLLHELLAERVPTAEVLYRAGLSELASTTMPKADIADLLTGRLRRTGLGFSAAA